MATPTGAFTTSSQKQAVKGANKRVLMLRIGHFCFRHRYFVSPMMILYIICGLATVVVASENLRSFGIDDYFSYSRVLELSLSADGRMIAYIVQSNSLDKNDAVEIVAVRSTKAGAKPVIIEQIQGGRKLSWIPGEKNELALLLDRDGQAQVYSFSLSEDTLKKLTGIKAGVFDYKFSHDGETLAFMTPGIPAVGPERDRNIHKSVSLYDEIFNSDHGVVLNSDVTSLFHFVNPSRSRRGERPETRLLVKSEGQTLREVRAPGEIREFHWAPDDQRLSLLYIANQNQTLSHSSYTSIGVFELSSMEFTPIARATAPSPGSGAEFFAGGEWLSDGSSIHIRRIVERNVWSGKAYWTILDLSKTHHFSSADTKWKPREHSSSSIADEKIVLGKSELYIERTVNGELALFEVESEGMRRAELIRDVKGTVRFVQFSDDFQTAAFVNERLTTPPEIFIWSDGSGVRQLTNLNDTIAERQLPRARQVVWSSYDGVKVHGWLLEPIDSLRGGTRPWPLITFVHGGPGSPVRNQFAYCFYGEPDSFGKWPYPLEVYATNGFAVFLPNYRGTKTYSNQFATPKTTDGEPVDDILSGIDYLIKMGVADPERVGITGHSHGAWLGPLVMTRSSQFEVEAGSFAEGGGNAIVVYELMPGTLNRITHDVQWGEGASLYANPQRYIELSPSLHFKGLKTAVLFEAGAKSAAVIMLGYQKAARFAGMPSELVSYPETGHNMVLPHLKHESATRNLDWFRFWLQGHEDPDPAKADQYARWRNLRREHCSKEDPERPRYCDDQGT